MSDIMHEIQDDLRQQQLKQFWQQNGSWIIGGAVLAVVMTGALTFWRGHVQQVNETQTAALMATLQTGTTESLEQYAADSKASHGMMARFMAAGLEAQRGHGDKAAAIYDEIAGMRGIEKKYKQLAQLLAAGHRLNTEDPAKLHDTLQDLTGKKDAWRYSALEMEALVYAREGKMQQAADTLAEISASREAPEDVRTRAMTLRELYLGALAEKQTEKSPAK